MRKLKKVRKLKVVEQSGYKYKPTPTIILKGQWVGEWGFYIGDALDVTCEKGRIIITLAN